MVELDGLEPGTEYTVHVWVRVAGVEGTPASVAAKTGEWILANCYPHLIGYPALLSIPDGSVTPSLCHYSVASLPTLTPH